MEGQAEGWEGTEEGEGKDTGRENPTALHCVMHSGIFGGVCTNPLAMRNH